VLPKTPGKGPFQMADGVRLLGAYSAQSGGADLIAGRDRSHANQGAELVPQTLPEYKKTIRGVPEQFLD
jgi:hypothetical protein